MMKAPTPKESKKDKAARASEQARAEAAQLDETQALLRAETLRRIRRFGQIAGAATSLPGAFGGGVASASGRGAAGLGIGGMDGIGGLGSFSGLQIGTA